MRGERYLTKPQQYAFVYQKGKSWASSAVAMKAVKNELSVSRYGFSISKKVGNAVTRNRVKRWLREILRAMPLKTGYDLVFIARPTAATDYWKLRQAVGDTLSRAHLLETGKKPEALAEIKPGGEQAGN